MAETRRMCPHCRAFITTRDKVCPYCNTEVGPRAIDRRDTGATIAGIIPHARFVTSLILLVNVALYAATGLFSMSIGRGGLMNPSGEALYAFGAKYGPAIARGEWWRLITAGFLHGGVMHILMNSWVLLDLGAAVEELYGWARMVVIYLAATVAGFYLSALWSPVLSIGASAGIFGLLGAMIALSLRDRAVAAMRGLYVRWAIYGLLIGFLPFFPVDNAAHIGGLAAGFAIAYLAGTPKLVETAPIERLWRAAGWAAVVITGCAFLLMYLWFSRATS